MSFDALTITALVVFFVAAAAGLYRWLMHICSKLCDCRQSHEQAASGKGQS